MNTVVIAMLIYAGVMAVYAVWMWYEMRHAPFYDENTKTFVPADQLDEDGYPKYWNREDKEKKLKETK